MADQCAALKNDATKCKNHSRDGSKFCASHKNWRPSGTPKATLDNLKKARAMKEVRARAKKTAGGTGPIRNRPAAVKLLGSVAQCAAHTASGGACKNLPKTGSKYCPAHKGYRAPKVVAKPTKAATKPVKTVAKKAATKKVVAKKTTVKKVVAKKPVVKKTAAKPAKKAVAKAKPAKSAPKAKPAKAPAKKTAKKPVAKTAAKPAKAPAKKAVKKATKAPALKAAPKKPAKARAKPKTAKKS